MIGVMVLVICYNARNPLRLYWYDTLERRTISANCNEKKPNRPLYTLPKDPWAALEGLSIPDSFQSPAVGFASS